MIKLKELSNDYVSVMVEAALESVSDINPWMPWCTNNFNDTQALSWVQEQREARQSRIAYEFAVFDKNDLYLGGGGINNINSDNNFANIGYWIRSSQTKKGYGTAALVSLARWAHNNTSLNRLEVVVAKGNIASHRVAEKAGFTFEALASSRLYLHGRYHDANMFVLTRAQA